MPFGEIAASGWASGLNLYGTALLLGLAGRLGWADTPDELHSTPFLVVAAVLYAVEFVVDKVPWLDSAWDAVHTLVRPVGGALLGLAMSHDAGSAELVGALVGGGFSLTAHSAKATTRAVVNTSPEPFSNIVLSFAEDGLAAAMVGLALAYPMVAGAVAVVAALASIAVVWTLWRVIHSVRARRRERRARSRGRPAMP